MRKVRCVSPHGGARHGVLHNGDPALPGDSRPLRHPPHEAGYVDVPALRRTVAVGDEIEAPEPPGFIADGFHFADAATGAADECAGKPCWCAQHPPEPAGPAPANTTATPQPSPDDTGAHSAAEGE